MIWSWPRFLMHFWIGVVVAALLLARRYHLGWMLALAFLVYEVWEGIELLDSGWKDWQGFVGGLVAVAIAFLIWITIGKVCGDGESDGEAQ